MPSLIARILAFFSRKQNPAAEEMFGLYSLYPPSPQSENWRPEVEVVAIHGLGGHPMKTWSKEHKLWLRDLLPGHLPSHNLRISSFGYNSAVFGRSRSQIRHFAEQLLNDLHQRRRETKTTGIPIVFVCHSLGGIVCKKALNIAHEHARVHRDITQSTKGIVFMGTPHLGADVAAWGRFFGNIGNVVTFGSFRTDLLKDLKSKSREFGDIATSFVERAADLQIVSMFERRPTKGILVVDEVSATLRAANERTIPVECNHVQICQLSGLEGYYSTVSGAVVELIEHICPVSDSEKDAHLRKECLDCLYSPDFHARIANISEKHHGTFEWIWTHPEYTKWEASEVSTLFWLQGKPASGKSTLTKSVRVGLEHRPRPGSSPPFSVVDFFYSDRGGDVQRGHDYMLRSIIYQVLCVIPSSWEGCRAVYSNYKRKHAVTNPPPPSSLDLETLKSMFTQSISTIKVQTILYIIIDAMDESVETKRKEIMELLTSFCGFKQQNLILKIFVASRPIPGIEVAFKNHISLRLEDETERDIQHYVQSEIKRISNAMDINPDLLVQVVDGLIERSRGVFLWVKLVIVELEEKASTDGCTIADIEQLLWSLPLKLEELYARILDKMAKSQYTAAVRLFQWVAYYKRSLTLPEIQEAMALDACPEPFTSTDLERNKVINRVHAERRLASVCGGLIEVKNNTVQFLHQTVREFLIQLPDSSPFHITQKSGEEYIISTCNRYMGYINRVVQATTDAKYPLEWSRDELDLVIGFVEGLHLFDYAMLEANCRHDSGDHEILMPKLLHNATLVVQTLSDAIQNATTKHYSEAIVRLLRIAIGERYADRSKLDIYVDFGSRNELWRVVDRGGHYPIHIAAERGYTHVISLLVDMGAFVDTTQASNGATALHLASMNGHDATVRLLLEKGAQKEIEDEDGLTALQLAGKNGHDSVLRLLGDHSLQPPTFSR